MGVVEWPSAFAEAASGENSRPVYCSENNGGARTLSNNKADDAKGFECPLGAHARRMNPRDSTIVGVVPLHRIIRRSTSFGPMLPVGVMEDDGVERGIIFVGVCANLEPHFECLKTQACPSAIDNSRSGGHEKLAPRAGLEPTTLRLTE
jgi:deferrochelatase/peroxidase EfeB